MFILFALIVIIILMVLATTRLRLHPFLSLLLAGVLMGFVGGLNENDVIVTITNGFGDTLSSIGIIIAFGTIIGSYLEKSGGALTLANWVLKIIGQKNSILAMNIAGYIVSIAVFCDSGFIVLSSLNKAISKRTKISLIALGVSLAAGLYATHVLVPPTPGPLAATAALNANLGLVIVLGLIVSIPVSLVGFLWASYIGKNTDLKITTSFIYDASSKELPKPLLSFAPILVPIALIALKTISNYPTYPLGENLIFEILNFIGNPIIALSVGVFISFKLKKDTPEETHLNWVTFGLKEAGIIILITGAGGAFGSVLRVVGIGEIIGVSLTAYNLGLFLPFLIAAILKSAQGSSTVAIITTSAILAPLLEHFGLDSTLGRALTVLSIGAGAMTVSHVNDSFFWVVAQFTKMNTATALKSHTVSSLFQGITGLILIILINWLFA